MFTSVPYCLCERRSYTERMRCSSRSSSLRFAPHIAARVRARAFAPKGISHVLDDIPTFRTAVLVSVLLGVQRQLPEICVGVPDLVSVIGEGRRSADRGRRRDFYRPLRLSLRLGRRARRPL